MPFYRKRPIPVEARQYTGDNFLELEDWSNGHVALSDYNDDAICVYTLEGPVWCEGRTDVLIDRVITCGDRAD